MFGDGGGAHEPQREEGWHQGAPHAPVPRAGRQGHSCTTLEHGEGLRLDRESDDRDHEAQPSSERDFAVNAISCELCIGECPDTGGPLA